MTRRSNGETLSDRCLRALMLMFLLPVLSGCGIAAKYDVGDDGPQPAMQAVPDYRRPAPPANPPPQPVMQPRTQQSSPALLVQLQQKANAKRNCEYALDDKFMRYHRITCPYAPRSKHSYVLRTQGNELVHQETALPAGTLMNRREIKAKGYKPCGHCRPDLDTPPPWYQEQTPNYMSQ